MGEPVDPIQEAFMNEKCILVNEKDEEVESASKIECHKGEGKLHRAFSVFFFNEKGELLLQQRAKTKITFPLVWANTCCSHPLNVDEEKGGVNGVFNAAHRKCIQELGLTIPVQEMHFITRIKYFARFDDDWCESEIDYLIFVNGLKSAETKLNPNEVNDVKWVTKEALKEMLDEHERNHGSNVVYSETDAAVTTLSPWFRLIAQKILPNLWIEWEEGKANASEEILLLE